MKSNIKAVFFDVDGTLMSHKEGDVPKSAREALEKLKKNGIKIVVATGRHMIEYSKLPISDIKFDGYLTLNGNLTLDADRKVHSGMSIDPGEMEVLAQVFKGKKIPFTLICENTRYINYVDDVVVKTQHETMGTIPDIGEYKGEKVYQILAFTPEDKQKILRGILDECKVTSWNDTGIDIIPKDGGKSAGIRKYIEETGIKQEETMAFGDGENDRDMIEYAGIGVAMGNATDSLKEVADYVTDSVDDDGIAKALRHFGLIDQPAEEAD